MLAALGILALGLAPPPVVPPSTAAPPAFYREWRASRSDADSPVRRVVLTRDPRVLYAIPLRGGLARSGDAGATWRSVAAALPQDGAVAVRDLLPDPRDENRFLVLVGDLYGPRQGLFESRDGGATYRKLVGAVAAGNAADRSDGPLLARAPDDPRRLVVAGEDGEILLSPDDGRTWRSEPRFLGRLRPLALRFDRTEPRRLFLSARGDDGGFYRSEDAGRTWERVSPFAPTDFLNDEARRERLVGIVPGEPPRVSDDGGANWLPYGDGLPAPPRGERFEAAALASGPGFLLLATSTGDLFRRETNAPEWRSLPPNLLERSLEPPPFPDPPLFDLAVDPRAPDRLWLADATGPAESRDAGRTWTRAVAGLQTAVVRTLEPIRRSPDDPRVIVAGTTFDGTLVSFDSGATFSGPPDDFPSPRAVRSLAADPNDPRVILALAARTPLESPADLAPVSLWATVDGGVSWTRLPMTGLPSPGVHRFGTVAFDPRSSDRVLVAASGPDGGLYESSDAGISFRRIEGEGAPDRDFFDPNLWLAGREIAASPDGSLLAISRTKGELRRRDGDRFVPVRGVEGIPYEVAASPAPGVFLVATSRGVYRSDDGGRTWRRVSDRSARRVAFDRGDPRLAAAGIEGNEIGGGVLLSEDAGRNWRDVGAGLPDRDAPVVALAGGRLFVGTRGEGVLWRPLDSRGATPVAPAEPLPRRPLILPNEGPTPAVPLRLLAEPSFENPARALNGWRVDRVERGRLALETTAVATRNGSRALRLRTLVPDSRGEASAPLLLLRPTFRVTGSARAARPRDLSPQKNGNRSTSAPPREATVLLAAYDPDRRLLGETTLFDARTADTFRPFAADVTLPPGTAEARLTLRYEGSGSLDLDGLRFLPADLAVALPGPLPETLLTNPGFERPEDLARWSVVYLERGTVTVNGDSDGPKEGSRSLLVRANAPDSEPNGARGAASIRLSAVPRRVLAEGFVRSLPDDPTRPLREATVVLQGFDARGRQTLFAPLADARESPRWTPFRTEVPIPERTVVLFLAVVIEGRGAVGLDGVRLEPRDEKPTKRDPR